MCGSIRATVNSMLLVPSVNPRLGFQKKKMKNDNTLDTFYGFWKYLGVMGIFLTGVVLTWWGVNLVINDLVTVRYNMGPIGTIVLMPLIMGIIFSWLGVVEFLRIIREKE